MLDNITIGRFYNIESDIHKLTSLSKLINLIIFVISILLVKSMNILFILLTFEFILIMTSNIPFKVILKNILSIKYLIIVILIVNVISGVSLNNSIILILKTVGIISYSSLFVLTTSHNDIVKGLNQFLYPLSYIGVNVEVISLIISLAIMFIPLTIDEANRILKNLKIRGLSVDSTLGEKIFGLKSLIIPLFLMSIKKSDNIAEMMEIKKYRLNGKNVYRKSNWTYLDTLLVVIHVIIFVVALKGV